MNPLGHASFSRFVRAIAAVIAELRLAKLTSDAIGKVAPDLVRLTDAYEVALAEAGLTGAGSVLSLAQPPAVRNRLSASVQGFIVCIVLTFPGALRNGSKGGECCRRRPGLVRVEPLRFLLVLSRRGGRILRLDGFLVGTPDVETLRASQALPVIEEFGAALGADGRGGVLLGQIRSLLLA